MLENPKNSSKTRICHLSTQLFDFLSPGNSTGLLVEYVCSLMRHTNGKQHIKCQNCNVIHAIIISGATH